MSVPTDYRAFEHANCNPGCSLHPELHHAGWVVTGCRAHYFMPGMNVSECGRCGSRTPPFDGVTRSASPASFAAELRRGCR